MSTRRITAVLSDGRMVFLDEAWFHEIVDRGADWTMAKVTSGLDVFGVRVEVNPKYISHLWPTGQVEK